MVVDHFPCNATPRSDRKKHYTPMLQRVPPTLQHGWLRQALHAPPRKIAGPSIGLYILVLVMTVVLGSSLDTWLVTMVIVSPQDLVLWDPFQIGLVLAYKWG